METRISAIEELQQVPGIGPKLAANLYELGISSVPELSGRSAESLYSELGALKGVYIDPCVLYAFRGAVYFASHTEHEPELLKWWNWKDRTDYGGGLDDR